MPPSRPGSRVAICGSPWTRIAPELGEHRTNVTTDDPALIPIERATGPVLLVSGGDDRMWPAERMCRMLVDRARRFCRANRVRHLDFPDAGHVLFSVGDDGGLQQPMPFDLGGS